MKFTWFAISLIICILINTSFTSKSHPITTLLNAKWKKSPIVMEIAEYLFDESPTLYWDYIEKINNLKTTLYEMDSESKKYKSAVKTAEELIGTAHGSLLKLALSMHSLSPRVEAHFQIAREVLAHGDCETTSFITIGNKIACNLNELNAGLSKATSTDSSDVEDVYSFDHIYPGSENNTIITILYSEIGGREFKEFHEFLKKQAIRGKIKYISRHYSRNLSNQKLRLSGYGVELHLKSTEYKSQDDSPRTDDIKTEQDDIENEIEGFDFAKLKLRFPSLSHSLDRFRNILLEKSDEIAPLKAWEFQELGLQAAQRIASIQGEESLQMLQFISQNFPTQAQSLLHQEVSEDFRKEMKHNIDILSKQSNIHPPDSSLFINGLYFDIDTLDVGSMLETLRSELRVLDGLHKLKIEGTTASDLLTLDLSSESGSKEFAIDIRDSSIIWINDLENDKRYRSWPSSVLDLLRPTFPGMLRNIRKNMMNLVLIVDPIKSNSRTIIKYVESFVVHMAPLRVGFVFDSRNVNDGDAATGKLPDNYRAILCAFNYITQEQSAKDALSFLTDIYATLKSSEDVTYKSIRKQLEKTFTKLSAIQIDDILGDDSDYDYGRQISLEYLERTGFKKSPQALLNGIPLFDAKTSTDDFEEIVLTEIMNQMPTIQKAVFRGELTDNDNVVDYLMGLPHIMPRLNPRILTPEDSKYLDLCGTPHKDLSNVNSLMNLSNRDMTATLMDNLKYFTTKRTTEKVFGKPVHFLTIWIVADLDTKSGFETLKSALTYMKSSGGIRVAFIPNVEGTAISSNKLNLNRLVWAATHSLTSTQATATVLKWLDDPSTAVTNLPDPVKSLLSSTELHLKILRGYCQRVLNLKSSEIAIIVNGNVIGPFDQDEYLTADDYNLIERFTSHQYSDKIRYSLQKNNQNDNVEDNEVIDINSDVILKIVTILVPRQQTRSRFVIPIEIFDYHTAIKLPPKSEKLPFFEIFAVLDPASRGAQKLSSILILLRNVINCRMRVLLCAVDKHSDMPVKNFYRFVIEPEMQFTPDGKTSIGPYAKFVGIPTSPLLTQNLQVPENWLVEIVRSVYDLDNIKLIDINGPVHSEYELEYLLLEGHCFDSATGAPPRGLQMTLGTKDEPVIVDTIVMANLGYFQLKANPGAWLLKLRHGKSEEIYDIISAEGQNTLHSPNETRVIISSFRSHVLKVRVSKKPDQQSADLLGDDDDLQPGIWNSITSSFRGGASDGQQSETINIFSVASGHLYERLLRIMMLSVLKHTSSPVKFWFLKNYLSPQFIDFLPTMSKELNFQYELVQYKWPRWLSQQSEKQRTIWGYKILFLDVLFPLDVKKIIFVDADAIVRANIKELNEMDLGGAPYAYTPFCDSRTEMEGFRFWKQGYWRNHLQGRKYHISALYVVDLKRFRKIAAGDRLRGQYQALSQDPNSLSNLDQDLPNNMIHQVAIKSLPQEWLWCQTWCSDSTFETAKAIDLCNNPQTKEAKLTAAQRIVPEWKTYDTEIKNLMNRMDDSEHEESLPVTATDDGENLLNNFEDENLLEKDTKQIKHSEL